MIYVTALKIKKQKNIISMTALKKKTTHSKPEGSKTTVSDILE